MSEGLPVCSGAEAVRAFTKAGWTKDRQKGSHVMLKKPGASVVLSVPQHSQLKKGTLRTLVSYSGLTVEEFTKLL